MIRAQTRNEISRQIAERLTSIANNEQAASVSRRAKEGLELTPDEEEQYFLMFVANMRDWENIHYQYRQGMFDEEEFEAERTAWKFVINRNRSFQKNWCLTRNNFSREYVTEIEQADGHVMSTEIVSTRNIRWLITETLVVVLGIVIALGLDDYRTDRFERRLEVEYIERVQEDLKSDLAYIERVWNSRLLMKREALESIVPVIRGQAPVPESALEFLTAVSRGGVMGTSAAGWYADTTFQDLLATGNFRLIQDPDIRDDISDYYGLLESETLRVERRLSGYYMFVFSVMPGELRDDIDLDSLEQFGVDYALQRLLTDEFRNLLNQEYNLLLFMEGRQYEALAHGPCMKTLRPIELILRGDSHDSDYFSIADLRLM